MNKIEVYAMGLCAASVCADKKISKKKISEFLNSSNPTGITSEWTIGEKTFADGTPNPQPCNTCPEGRKHYLFVC